jgi:DNA-nicking Smr family endonuclease
LDIGGDARRLNRPDIEPDMTDKTPDKGPKKTPSKTAPQDADGKKAWARLTAGTTPLTGETRNRYIPEHVPEQPPKKGTTGATPLKKSVSKKPDLQKPAPQKPDIQKRELKNSAAAKPAAVKPTPQDDLHLRTRRRLSRGTIALDGQIDLHGLTLREAEAALAGFVKRAQIQNQIWLLVVTGKGARGEGKLRRALPEWLDRGALAGRVVEYGPAAPNHGGGGAFYLRLRRAKPAQ